MKTIHKTKKALREAIERGDKVKSLEVAHGFDTVTSTNPKWSQRVRVENSVIVELIR